MPITKPRTNNTLDTLKPMADNSVNTFIRQAVGNESLLSFSRTGDNPVQWVQLLSALDQQDLPGWPFLTPVKVQMQKCDKCSREFCSPINYRRHIRVHRRSLCVDKESHKNRDLLGAFWDKLSSETAKEIVSLDDATLEEVPGSSIIWSLTSFIRKPCYVAFPQPYVKAGSALLDIMQCRPDEFLTSSQELFAILDDASEGTFLTAGTAASMQKFVFDGEAGKIGLEPKNLVACTSFLIEQKLVREWLADMDAESLRCQKLLVEEEEAAQRRQAKQLERKRQKKLRQKEQKAKEQANGECVELEEVIVHNLDSPVSSETNNLSVSFESSSNFVEPPVDHPLPLTLFVEPTFTQRDADVEAQSGFSSEHSELSPYINSEHQRAFESECRQSNVSRWQVQKTQRARNGFHSGQDSQLTKVEPMQRHGPSRDPKPTQAVNANRVWTRKPKPELDNGEILKIQVEQVVPNQKPKPELDNGVSSNKQSRRAARTRKPKVEQDNGETVNTRVDISAPTQSHLTEENCQVMIGSITVALENGKSQYPSDPPVSENNCQDKLTKTDGRASRSKVNLWRPVSRHGSRSRSGVGESKEVIVREVCERAVPSDSWNDLPEGVIRPEEFSTEAAKAFLSQRWEEAIAGDHVTLILTPEPELLGCIDTQDDCHVITTPSGSQSCIVLGHAGNLQENVVVFEPSTKRPAKGKFKSNPEKGVKTKYIPKSKVVTGGK